jgi:hypothetical protein
VTNSESADQKQSTVTVVPNEPWPASSTIDYLNQDIILDTTETVTVTARDQYNNLLIDTQPLLLVA